MTPSRSSSARSALDPASADLQVRLLDYLQQAHRFAAAAAFALRLEAVHRFAAGIDLFAVPYRFDQNDDDDELGPISSGLDTARPVELPVFAGTPATAPATTTDLSFFPLYEPTLGLGGPARWCPGWSRLLDLLLAGQPRAVLAGFSTRLGDLRPGAFDCDPAVMLGFGAQVLPADAELDLGNLAAARAWGRKALQPASLSDLEDSLQNLWRYAGNLPAAAGTVTRWQQTLAGDSLALSDAGEIAFLQHRYSASAADFAVVADRARWRYGVASQQAAVALLHEGAALAYAGQHAEALNVLDAADQAAVDRSDVTGVARLTGFYAQEQEGTMLLGIGQPQQAALHYAVATDTERGKLSQLPSIPGGQRLRVDVLDNDRAIAALQTGDPALAATLARTAIGYDPGNAIYWWTLATADQQLGRRTAAVADNRAALARDPTEFPVANNLGVLLLQQGRPGPAADALRRAVGANRDYAPGWFNLAIALRRLGPGHVLSAEGSLARADMLDSTLASRRPRPFFDNALYASHLDLSKPLPPKWTFAASQSHAPAAAAGLSAILVAMIGLARSLAGRTAKSGVEKWLGLVDDVAERIPWANVLRAPALAVVATAAYLLWPARSGPGDSWSSELVFAIGVLILIAVVVRVRQIAAARSQVAITQETWLPGVGFGLVVTLLGLSWAPLPVARSRASGDESPSVHWAGPTVIAILALTLLLLATWLGVPVARSLGSAALLMAASMLTPVKPLDGATVRAGKAGALPVIAVLGTAVLTVTGLL